MEFMDFLAIAQRKQKKRDKEVEKIIKLGELKKKERVEEYVRAKKVRTSFTPAETQVKTFLPSNAAPMTSIVESSTCTKTFRSNKCSNNSSKPNEKRLPASIPMKQSERDVNRPIRSNKSDSGLVARGNMQPRTDSRSTQNLDNKRPKLSFSDLMELAKKNVQHESSKKNVFEDLLPCAPDSKYRRLDKTTSVIKSDRSITKCGAPKIAEPSKQNSSKNVNHGTFINQRASLNKKSNSSVDKTKPSIQPAFTDKSTIIPKPSLKAPISEGRLTNESLKVFGNKSSTVKKIASKAECSNGGNVEKQRTQTPTIQPSHTVSHSLAKPKFPNNHVKYAPSYSKSNKDLSVAHNPVHKNRGIAAQLGVNMSTNHQLSDSYSEGDDYGSDDSFIDDSEAVEGKTYARVIRDVHQALRFDPKKYAEINPFDELRSMEAKYRDIEMEEKRSARVGAREDAIELEKDIERKRRKKMLQKHNNK